MKEAFNLEVMLVNEAKSAAIAEKEYGAVRKQNNLVYVIISTGVGGGVIVDRHLLIGKDGNASDIGHLTYYEDSKLSKTPMAITIQVFKQARAEDKLALLVV